MRNEQELMNNELFDYAEKFIDMGYVIGDDEQRRFIITDPGLDGSTYNSPAELSDVANIQNSVIFSFDEAVKFLPTLQNSFPEVHLNIWKVVSFLTIVKPSYVRQV